MHKLFSVNELKERGIIVRSEDDKNKWLVASHVIISKDIDESRPIAIGHIQHKGFGKYRLPFHSDTFSGNKKLLVVYTPLLS